MALAQLGVCLTSVTGIESIWELEKMKSEVKEWGENHTGSCKVFGFHAV